MSFIDVFQALSTEEKRKEIDRLKAGMNQALITEGKQVRSRLEGKSEQEKFEGFSAAFQALDLGLLSIPDPEIINILLISLAHEMASVICSRAAADRDLLEKKDKIANTIKITDHICDTVRMFVQTMMEKIYDTKIEVMADTDTEPEKIVWN
jgi:hypothetical protein